MYLYAFFLVAILNLLRRTDFPPCTQCALAHQISGYWVQGFTTFKYANKKTRNVSEWCKYMSPIEIDYIHCWLYSWWLILLVTLFVMFDPVYVFNQARERPRSYRVQWSVCKRTGWHLDHNWEHSNATSQSNSQRQAGTWASWICTSVCLTYKLTQPVNQL